MKKLINTILIAFATILLTSCMALQGGAYSQNGYDRGYEYYGDDDYYYGDNNYDDRYGISIHVFYNALRQHGRWMRHGNYGEIWVPRVARDFHPYATNGYWVMTDYGNTWISNYSWGWAPFHYGRWFHDDHYGWAWVPGYEWAPAWVSWRSGGGYYGWAPMSPSMGIDIQINLPIDYWVFLPNRYMYQSNMHRYYTGRNYCRNVYNNTIVLNNTNIYGNNRYYSGPSAREYRHESGRSANVRALKTNGRSRRTTVGERSVSVYTPKNSRSSGARRSNREINSSRSSNRSPRETDIQPSTPGRSSSTSSRSSGEIRSSESSSSRRSSEVRSSRESSSSTRSSSGSERSSSGRR